MRKSMMNGRARSSVCSLLFFRSYSTVLQVSRVVLLDPHIRGVLEYPKKKRTRTCKPVSIPSLLYGTRFATKNSQNRSEIQRKATQISKSWSIIDSLVQPVSPRRNDDEVQSENTTKMTTNFMIYAPYQNVFRASEGLRPERSQILHNLQVLLLKRSPDADPFPGGWTVVSGRLETDNSGILESPIDGALREIKEETNQEPAVFTLETALPPLTVQSPDGKMWRVWPILWRKKISLDDSKGLLDPESGPNYSIKLNDENVEFAWKRWADMKTLPGLVPGLAKSFEQLVDKWVEEESPK